MFYGILARMSSHSTQTARPKALLVGLQLPRISVEDTQSSLAELKRLVDTLGFEVVGQTSQKRSGIGGATVVGEGKLRELAKWTGGPGIVQSQVQVKKHKAAERFGREKAGEDSDLDSDDAVGAQTGDEDDDALKDASLDADEDALEAGDAEAAEGDELSLTRRPVPANKALPQVSESVVPEGVTADTVIFDCELTPSQLRNLESATGAKVLDRTGVIIEIFSRHARTRAARLQVEIARLNYLAPRLRETGGGDDRGGGGIGGKGAGETSQELDRRRIRDRVKELRGELAAVQKEGDVRRTRRSTENCVALVGYTNAGKSSLMRALTGSEILVADKLFATLETTVRPLAPPSVPKVLVSDTVGFIKKLPHDLVASFRSTLDEALNADLLLFVVDASDPTFRAQLAVTKQVIGEVGALETPGRLVLNKRDRLAEDEIAKLRLEFPDAIFLSTRDREDLAALRETMIHFFESDMRDEDFFVPFDRGAAIGEVRRLARVLNESYDERGTHLRVRANPVTLEQLRKRYSL